MPGIDIPTFIEAGRRREPAELARTRGTPRHHHAQRDELVAIVEEMAATPEWTEVMERNRWRDALLTGSEFADFIEQDQARVNAIIEELGL